MDARPAARHRHGPRRPGALAGPAGQSAAAGLWPALPRLRGADVRERAPGRARRRPRSRRPAACGDDAGLAASRRRGAARLPLVPVRHRPEGRLRVAGEAAARRTPPGGAGTPPAPSRPPAEQPAALGHPRPRAARRAAAAGGGDRSERRPGGLPRPLWSSDSPTPTTTSPCWPGRCRGSAHRSTDSCRSGRPRGRPTSAPGRVPPWLDEVNLDPRHRVAAGLGAEVVRRNQEHYVEEAWRQVGDVLAANRLRRRAEFSLAATTPALRPLDHEARRRRPAHRDRAGAPEGGRGARARRSSVGSATRRCRRPWCRSSCGASPVRAGRCRRGRAGRTPLGVRAVTAVSGTRRGACSSGCRWTRSARSSRPAGSGAPSCPRRSSAGSSPRASTR